MPAQRNQHALFLEGDPDRIERHINRILAGQHARLVLVSFQPIKVDPTIDYNRAVLKDSPNRYACIVVYEVDA